MNFLGISIACLISFIVSVATVSIGGTALITVPVLIWLGIVTKDAIATNMFALIFLSIFGAVGFRKEIRPTHNKKIFLFLILTICGSLIGANLVIVIDENILKKVIAIIICIIAGAFLFKKDLGIREEKGKISKVKFFIGMLSIFILGIYGGFFSGGYVTLLTYILIVVFGLDFLQSALITKIFNIFSSLVACIFFFSHGLINFSVGIPLAISMSLGAFFGTKLAIAKGNLWVRNLFVTVVILLALKLLIF